MSDAAPHAFERRILLAVLGLTPQVVTETLYVLSVTATPPFVPTEVHLATTREGRERALLTLLDEETGALPALARDYGLPQLAEVLKPERIHVLAGADGAPLDDIRTPAENLAAADRLIEIVGQLTADPKAALHVSIAGGRKTMGFFLGYALSLFGRPQDRLSHVLVPEPFEFHPLFFYPPPRPRILYTRDNRPVRTDAAVISLAELPFVRLRSGLPDRLLRGQASFAETVAGAQSSLGEPALLIDCERRLAMAAGRPMRLPPVLFAWLVWMARRRCSSAAHGGALHWREASADEFLATCRELYANEPERLARMVRALGSGMSKDYFDEKKSRYNKLMRSALGLNAEPYYLRPFGRRPHTRFGLGLDPGCIRFTALDSETEPFVLAKRSTKTGEHRGEERRSTPKPRRGCARGTS